MITRLAPSPNYYAHLGHLRGLLLLARKAREEPGSKIYLRFDDTGEEDYRPEYYRSFLRLFRRYRVPLAGVIRASQRLDLYRRAVLGLWRRGHAYVCECSNQVQKAYREGCDCHSKALPWQALTPDRVVRMRSERQADYVLLRYVKSRGVHVPTLGLQSAVDDKILGVNYLYRGRDLESSQARLREIYGKLSDGNKFPACRYWGRMALYDSKTGEEYPLSKRLRRSERTCPGLPYLEQTYGTENLSKFILSYGDTKQNIKADLHRLRCMTQRRGSRKVRDETGVPKDNKGL